MQIEPNTKKRALVTGANRGIGLAIAIRSPPRNVTSSLARVA